MPRIYNQPCAYCSRKYKSGAKKFCSHQCYSNSRIGVSRNVIYFPKKCVNCRNTYVPTNGTGKRCPPCSKIYIRQYKITQMKNWRTNNPDYEKISYWKNPEKNRLYALNRKHKKRANGGRGVTPQEWEKLKHFYKYTCQICRLIEPVIRLTQDHIIPIAKGGRHEIENIQPLCLICNCRKGIN